ncbi:MAG: NAD(P)-dependent oxidoreductase [Actinomycetota bacterium]|nr:NAD(P)-dependent oxidoreductase [Actinomycetota bacterium]
MRVFVAGASGAIGRPLIRQLVAAGHDVTGSSRTPARAAEIAAGGGTGIVCDALDPEAVKAAVIKARPEVVINQLTSLPAKFKPNQKGYFHANDRLRVEGGRNLIDAAAAASARRVISQSVAFLYAPVGGTVKTEADPVDGGPRNAAALELERMTLTDGRFEPVVLRYGLLYGPGTWYSPEGHLGREVAQNRLPIVGAGTGVASFVATVDAASAAVAALDRGEGIFNVVDDDPAPMREWLPGFAAALRARPPRRVPPWIARMIAGRSTVDLALNGRGASNARAKQQLGWAPVFPTWRQGFAASVGLPV